MLTRRLTPIVLLGLWALPAAAGPSSPAGRWRAETIDGGGVLDRVQTTLEIRDDGIVSGTGGCNRYAGSAHVDGERIRFAPMGSTRMACAPAVMNQETKFHRALARAAAWRIDEARRKLTLLDDRGFDLIRLTQMD
jgi:heat shock protein HslJ